ncbi:hypothetical protein [Sphingomonas sp. SORGH_AS_0802]|uniref:hypothetical protein n=1 Tax=Sphingomonas sp. SORGH_AS_0802 TaxID=3041800 RepID=UPI00286D0D27|nr:hypothetical protein [Sphingomonas sp. SORGH_AS_0802]
MRSLSLRKVTASVDRSTGSVFQTFTGRDELLCAVLEEAVRRDGAWHRQWASSLAGMRLDGAGLANIVADYLIERARSAEPGAAVWQDAMFEGDAWPIAAATAIAAGVAVQTAFWRDLLDSVEGGAALAEAIVTFGIMESAYATILHEDIAYRLLVRATTSALVEQAMGGGCAGGAGSSAVMEWADTQTRPVAPVAPAAPLAARLLHAAATAIRQEGVAALNLRRIATPAKASPSPPTMPRPPASSRPMPHRTRRRKNPRSAMPHSLMMRSSPFPLVASAKDLGRPDRGVQRALANVFEQSFTGAASAGDRPAVISERMMVMSGARSRMISSTVSSFRSTSATQPS